MSAFEAPHNPVRGGMEEVPPPISIPVFTTEEGSVSVDDYRYVASVVQGNTFTVDVRYDFNESKILGRSSWGVVCSVWDRVEQQAVALRRYRPYADDDWDARGLLRELRILKLFKLHPNIKTMHNLSLYPPKQELYMVFDLLDCDLQPIIQSKQPLTEKHIKYFLKQILEGLDALHDYGIVHRNLKPSNILVRKDCKIQIAGFSCAKHISEDIHNETDPMISYVVARCNASPQVVLASIALMEYAPIKLPYSTTEDLWGVGILLAELMIRNPFIVGGNVTNQLRLMLKLAGYHQPSDLEVDLSHKMQALLESYSPSVSGLREEIVKRAEHEMSDALLSLVESFLQVSPSKRITAKAALGHPYFETCASHSSSGIIPIEDEELTAWHALPRKEVSMDYFNFEDDSYSLSDLQRMIEDEVYDMAANAYLFPAPADQRAIDYNIMHVDKSKRRSSKTLKMKSHSVQSII